LFSIAMARLPEFHQGPLGDDAHVAKPFSPIMGAEGWFVEELLSPGTPRHTLVATGTGFGQNESFLLPLLEHCRQQHAGGQTGLSSQRSNTA
jgi:DEAD/DEAH box helicase domain-containing protein